MRLVAFISAFALAPSIASACPGKDDSTTASMKSHKVDASACAKKAALIGGSCSYSTGMMLSRVIEQGKSFAYTGMLQQADKPLLNQVAAPFQVGPDQFRVIANEVVETAALDERLNLTGKVLEVDGVTYFVVTSFEKANV